METLPMKPEFIRGGMNCLSTRLEETSRENTWLFIQYQLGKKIHMHLNVPCLKAQKQMSLCEEAEGFSSGV